MMDTPRGASVSEMLVNARRGAYALPAFPDALPITLDEAYAVQSQIIRGWGAAVAGWKVGRITGEAEVRFGRDRFIGPIFSGTIREVAADTVSPFPAIAGGTAALEAEVIAILGQDIPPARGDWTAKDMPALLSDLHIGIEVAGCPIPDIGRLGPLASIAASGNNLALLVGPAIPDWRDIDIDAISCSVDIDDTRAGTGTAGDLPGGLLAAIAFALNQAAELRIGLPAETLLSTGAIGGVHGVHIGQQCRVDFGSLGLLRCHVVEAAPSA